MFSHRIEQLGAREAFIGSVGIAAGDHHATVGQENGRVVRAVEVQAAGSLPTVRGRIEQVGIPRAGALRGEPGAFPLAGVVSGADGERPPSCSSSSWNSTRCFDIEPAATQWAGWAGVAVGAGDVEALDVVVTEAEEDGPNSRRSARSRPTAPRCRSPVPS